MVILMFISTLGLSKSIEQEHNDIAFYNCLQGGWFKYLSLPGHLSFWTLILMMFCSCGCVVHEHRNPFLGFVCWESRIIRGN